MVNKRHGVEIKSQGEKQDNTCCITSSTLSEENHKEGKKIRYNEMSKSACTRTCFRNRVCFFMTRAGLLAGLRSYLFVGEAPS